MCLGKFGSTFLANDERSNQPSSISSDKNVIDLLIVVDGHELLNSATLSKDSEVSHKLCCLFVYSDRLTVEENENMLG